MNISLTIDYAGSVNLGDWIDVSSDMQKAVRTMNLANCYFTVNSNRSARASAVFSVTK